MLLLLSGRNRSPCGACLGGCGCAYGRGGRPGALCYHRAAEPQSHIVSRHWITLAVQARNRLGPGIVGRASTRRDARRSRRAGDTGNLFSSRLQASTTRPQPSNRPVRPWPSSIPAEDELGNTTSPTASFVSQSSMAYEHNTQEGNLGGSAARLFGRSGFLAHRSVQQLPQTAAAASQSTSSGTASYPESGRRLRGRWQQALAATVTSGCG